MAADVHKPISAWGYFWRYGLVLLIMVQAVLFLRDGWQNGELLTDSNEIIVFASGWRMLFDFVIGLVAAVTTFWRRRRPRLVACLVAALFLVATSVQGPILLALGSLATRRLPWTTAALWLGAVLTVWLRWEVMVFIDPGGFGERFVAACLWYGSVVAIGLYFGSRRELVWNLEQRAVRAETEQALRADEARTSERNRIAREMHDVVAHRISQVSMRAGAMAFRTDLSVDDLRAESEVVRASANAALDELRSVLRVLRDPESDAEMTVPQPTYGDVARLVAEAGDAGMSIDFVDTIETEPTSEIGLALYRIVQEGLTNAAKHAPGSRLSITLRETDGGILLEMSNPLGFASADTPGSGLGLLGIEERVKLAGGTLQRSSDGTTFLLRAWLPRSDD
jgi:signal transduction histidine kinase